MNKFITVFVLFLLIIVLAPAGSPAAVNNLKMRLYMSTTGSEFDNLVFGVDRKATDRLDTALGESLVPPFIPPSGLHGYFNLKYIDTTIQEEAHTYTDLRPFPAAPGVPVVYNLHVENITDTLTIKWFAFGSEIDSAFLVETVSGKSLDMKSTTFYGRFLFPSSVDFRMVVWYNYDYLTDVLEENLAGSYPGQSDNIVANPVSDRIVFNSLQEGTDYRIISVTGNVVAEGKSILGLNEVQASGFAPGVYFIIFNYSDGNSATRKFIKL
jgi:hypothetical protein